VTSPIAKSLVFVTGGRVVALVRAIDGDRRRSRVEASEAQAREAGEVENATGSRPAPCRCFRSRTSTPCLDLAPFASLIRGAASP
jgi:hypothetical protein